MQTQSNDFHWFLDNYDTLFKEYGRKYLAIKDHRVIGAYDSYKDGVIETAKTEKLGTFIVQFCDGSNSAYTNTITSMNFMLA